MPVHFPGSTILQKGRHVFTGYAWVCLFLTLCPCLVGSQGLNPPGNTSVMVPGTETGTQSGSIPVVNSSVPGDAYTPTKLRMLAPSELPAAKAQRSAVEQRLLEADPESLRDALSLIATSTLIPLADRTSYQEIAGYIADLLYPQFSGWTMYALETPRPSTPVPEPPRASPSLSGLLGELVEGLASFADLSPARELRALSAAKAIEAAGVNSVFPRLMYGRRHELAGNYTAAINEYRLALSSHPSAWSAAVALVRCLYEEGEWSKAAEVASVMNPDFMDAYPFLAWEMRAYHAENRLSDAFSRATRILNLSIPDRSAVLIRLHHLVETLQYSMAREWVVQYPEPQSEESLYFELRSRILVAGKDYAGAMDWVLRGLAVYPDDPSLHALAASIESASGRGTPEKVLGHANTALALLRDQSSGGARIAPGRISGETDRPVSPSPLEVARRAKAGKDAARLVTIAMSRGQDWKQTVAVIDLADQMAVDQDTQSRLLRNSSRFVEAEIHARNWYRESAASPQSMEALLRTFVASGKNDQALVVIGERRDKSINPSLESLMLCIRGDAAKTGTDVRTEGSEALYRQALFLKPDSLDALISLARYYFLNGEIRRGNFYRKQARALGTNEVYLASALGALDAEYPPDS